MAISIVPSLFVAIFATGRNQLIQYGGHIFLQPGLKLNCANRRRAAGQSEPANYGLFPIYGFQLDLVSAPGLPVMFTSGAGTLTYSVSSGALSVQTANTCGGPPQLGTAENSNIVYQPISPASGSTVSQAFAAPAMGMNFYFDKSTFGQDEVAQASTW